MNIRHASTKPQITIEENNKYGHTFAQNDGTGGDWFRNFRYDQELFYDNEYNYLCQISEQLKKDGMLDDSAKQFLYRERNGVHIFKVNNDDDAWDYGWEKVKRKSNGKKVSFEWNRACYKSAEEAEDFLKKILDKDPSCRFGGHIRTIKSGKKSKQIELRNELFPRDGIIWLCLMPKQKEHVEFNTYAQTEADLIEKNTNAKVFKGDVETFKQLMLIKLYLWFYWTWRGKRQPRKDSLNMTDETGKRQLFEMEKVITALVNRKETIKLVTLNACETSTHVDELFKRGIKSAWMGTPCDERAQKFAVDFYQLYHQGNTASNSFKRAKDYIVFNDKYKFGMPVEESQKEFV